MLAPKLEVVSSPVTIYPDEKRVVLNDLTCDSREIFNFLSRSRNITEDCLSALEVGCLSLARVGTSSEIDFVREATLSLYNDINRDVTSLITGAKEAACQGANRLLEELNADRKTSLLSKLEERLNERMARLDAGIQTTFQEGGTAAESIRKTLEKGGLAALREEMKLQFTTLIQSVSEQIALMKQPAKTSHAIGEDFENVCIEKLQAFAQSHSLAFEDTRNVAGGSKVGDFVLSGEGIQRIACEAKNKHISVPALVREAHEALDNRHASVCLFILHEDILPADVGLFNMYGSKIIACSSEIAEVGLRIALAKAQQAHNETTGKEGLADLTKAAQITEEILLDLGQFSKLRTNISALKRTAGKIESLALEIREAIQEKAEDLAATLVPATGAGKGESDD